MLGARHPYTANSQKIEVSVSGISINKLGQAYRGWAKNLTTA